MTLETETQRWFALQVRTRWESSTAVLLSGKGYEALLPTYKAKKRWNGRLREIDAPLFPGYVFCRFDTLKRLPVLVTPGVIAVVGRGRVPLPGSAPNRGRILNSAREFASSATRWRVLREFW